MRYFEYLKTDHWQAKRLEKLVSVSYRCEECGRRRATCVHHLSYDNLGNEPLSDLLGLCKWCHEELHMLSMGQLDEALERSLRNDQPVYRGRDIPNPDRAPTFAELEAKLDAWQPGRCGT